MTPFLWLLAPAAILLAMGLIGALVGLFETRGCGRVEDPPDHPRKATGRLGEGGEVGDKNHSIGGIDGCA